VCAINSGRGRGAGRGRMRGFGRRGRGGRGGGSQIPTKDELDAQLDAYNAKVCFVLFKVKWLLALVNWWLKGSLSLSFNIPMGAGNGGTFPLNVKPYC